MVLIYGEHQLYATIEIINTTIADFFSSLYIWILSEAGMPCLATASLLHFGNYHSGFLTVVCDVILSLI